MRANDLSEDLNRFIATEVQSVEQMEILLLLSGNPHLRWTSRMVYEAIKTNLASIERRLERYVRSAIFTKEMDDVPTYQFSPANEVVWRLVSELREEYKRRPVRVVDAIYTVNRSDPAEEFARAFRIKKDKNG